MRARLFVLLVVAALSRTAGAAQLYYASGTVPDLNAILSGRSLVSYQYMGTRFTVSSPITVSHVGGAIYTPVELGDNRLFAAIVSMSENFDLPNSDALNTP